MYLIGFYTSFTCIHRDVHIIVHILEMLTLLIFCHSILLKTSEIFHVCIYCFIHSAILIDELNSCTYLI